MNKAKGETQRDANAALAKSPPLFPCGAVAEGSGTPENDGGPNAAAVLSPFSNVWFYIPLSRAT